MLTMEQARERVARGAKAARRHGQAVSTGRHSGRALERGAREGEARRDQSSGANPVAAGEVG